MDLPTSAAATSDTDGSVVGLSTSSPDSSPTAQATFSGVLGGDEPGDPAWPSHCCVPAFIFRALCELSSEPTGHLGQDIRELVAQALGVTVPLDDPNPWCFTTSAAAVEWGVSVPSARERFAEARRVVPGCDNVVLEVKSILEIGFEMYEERIRDLAAAGNIVGVAFDYGPLGAELKRPGTGRTHHLVRLTPYDAELALHPNILSAEFDFDYEGDVWVFDDSSGLDSSAALVPWRTLIRSCLSIDGWLWLLRRGSG